MANKPNSKLKILYLLQMFMEKTDSEHGLTMAQIIDELETHGITAERKSIYSDIDILKEFGLSIEKRENNSPTEYGLVQRQFELDDLMLMIDAIHSCRAITQAKARDLTSAIKQLASENQRGQLSRMIHVEGRVKTMDDSVFIAIDRINQAIAQRQLLSFRYKKSNVPGLKSLVEAGKKHVVVPAFISYDDGFYYLTAWDSDTSERRNFRLDRMSSLIIFGVIPPEAESAIKEYKKAESKAVMFGRFSGDEVKAILATKPDNADIIFDRCGGKARIEDKSPDEVIVSVSVCSSPQFFGWIAGMNNLVRIVGPDTLVAEYRAYLSSLLN